MNSFPLSRHQILALLVALLVLLGGYFLYDKLTAEPHFHANFHLYLDGEMADLSGDQYMTDLSRCVTADAPLVNWVHLHENIPDVVHMHANGITWRIFFESLGAVIDKDGVISFAGKTFPYSSAIIDNQYVEDYLDLPITSHSRNVIFFGDPIEGDLTSIWEAVPDTSHEYDYKNEVGCSA